jgi:hypothetical protein
MERAIGFLLSIMPLVFGFGFLVPTMRQAIERLEWAPPLALSPLAFALIVCGGWAIIAQVRQRWI